MTMMFIDVGDGLFSYEYLLRQTKKGLLQSGLTNIDEVSADIASLFGNMPLVSFVNVMFMRCLVAL